MSTDRDLVITRDIAVPRDKLYRCWTEPELIKRWFAHKPWTTPHAETDVRAGGASLGGEARARRPGVPQPRRLPGGGAYARAWEPSAKPFMTVILTFENLGGGKTRYTARARHWTEAESETHEKMGFTEGWTLCTNQLAELAATL